jgi:RHS repeat-associated protein
LGVTPTDYHFTGQREDGTIKLIQMGLRWYDPELGRFLSADSIIPEPYNPLAYDRYSYVYNNPVRYTDPTGHCPMCIGALGGFIGGAIYGYGSQVANNLSQGQMNLGQALTTNISGETVLFYAGVGTVMGAGLGPVVAPAASYIAGAITTGGTAATMAETGTAVTTAACADGDCTNEAGAVENGLNAIRNMVGNAKGTAYEEWVQKLPGSEGNFRLPGAEYDNKIGNLLMEAKSFDWKNITAQSGKFTDFQNQVGRAYSIATQNGYQYVVRLLNKPPQFVLDWLEKKGYDYIIEGQ